MTAPAADPTATATLRIGRTTYTFSTRGGWMAGGEYGDALLQVVLDRPYPRVDIRHDLLVGAVIRRGSEFVAAHFRDMKLERTRTADSLDEAVQAVAEIVRDMRLDVLAARRRKKLAHT